MKEYNNYKGSEPVKISVCEGVMSKVIRGKKKKSVYGDHRFVKCNVDRVL